MQGTTLAVLPHPRKVLCAGAPDSTTLLAGCDGGSLVIWDTESPQEPLATIQDAHASRIRAITAPFEVPGAPGRCIATASSDGAVKVWPLEGLREGLEEPLAAADVGARFTCMCAFDERAAARDSAAGKAADAAAASGGDRNEGPPRGADAALANGGAGSGVTPGAADGGGDVAKREAQGGAADAGGPGSAAAVQRRGKAGLQKKGDGPRAAAVKAKSHAGSGDRGGKAGGKPKGKLGVVNGSKVGKTKEGKSGRQGRGGARGKGVGRRGGGGGRGGRGSGRG